MNTYKIHITDEQRRAMVRALNSYVNTNAGTNNVPKTLLDAAEDLGAALSDHKLSATELNNLTGIVDDEAEYPFFGDDEMDD